MEARQSQSAGCTWLVLSLQSPRSLVVLEMLSRMILFGNPGVRRPDGVRIGQMGELHQIVPDSSTSWLLQLASAVVCKRSASPQVHPIAACLYVALPSHVPPKYLSHPTPAFSIFSFVLNLPRSPAVHPVSWTLDRLLVFSLVVRTPSILIPGLSPDNIFRLFHSSSSIPPA